MIRFLCVAALSALGLAGLPTSVEAAGTIDSVNVGTEAKLGKTYLKVDGTFTTTATQYMVQVDIKCTTKPALNEGPLAADVSGKPNYKRLSDKEVEAQTYEVTVTLIENNVAVNSKKKTVAVTQPEPGVWHVTEIIG